MTKRIRLAASATTLVVLSALGITVATVEWRSRAAVASEATLARLEIEESPICSAADIYDSKEDWARLDPDFEAGKKAIANDDWKGAIAAFNFAAVRDPRNADIENFIGYAYQRMSQVGPAMGHFQQALSLNPRHRGAHEHLGELFLTLNEPVRAEQHLTALEQICLIPCKELENLHDAVDIYTHSALVH